MPVIVRWTFRRPACPPPTSHPSRVRVPWAAAALLLLVGTIPTGLPAQDVVRRGQIHGTEVPTWIREALARDPNAFEVRNGWKAELAQVRARRSALAARGLAPRALSGPQAVAAGVAVNGVFEVPVFLVRYENTKDAPYEASALEALLYTGPSDKLTLTEYYDEVSRKAITLTGRVLDWVTTPHKDTYYEGDDNGVPPALGELIRQAVMHHDPAIDFSRYDHDGDGIVDAIALVHPETGGECGGANIWSHRWTYPAASGGKRLITDDNVEIVDYSIQPALNCDGETPIDIGVFAHEYGHLFGLPDLYSTSDANAGIGEWGLMASGSWNTPESPAHLSAWSKAELGWIPVRTLGEDSDLRLEPAETTGEAIEIPVDGAPGEYFLIENRQSIGSDRHLRGTGLLVWHIDTEAIDSRRLSNTVQNDTYRKGVDLEEADGGNGLDDPAGSASPGHPFPGSASVDRFGVVTSPSSASNAGVGSGIELTDIVEHGDGSVTLSVNLDAGGSCSATELLLGQTGVGALGSTDCQDGDGRYRDGWVLDIASTTTITLDLMSAEFDAYMVVASGSGEILATDDDGGEGLNSRIEIALEPGRYLVWVTSFSIGATGAYTLAVTGSEGTGCTAAAIAVGESRSGSLATSDCSDSDGRYMDPWTFSLAAGADVIVDLTSGAFDTYLLLARPDGTVLQQDDDGGSGLNSRIEASLGAGDYVVWATSYTAGATGAYTLAVAGSEGTSCATAAIAVGASRSGSLVASDCSGSDGRYMDPWTLSLGEGANVIVDLTSDAFDTYLLLARPDGTVLEQNDDGGNGLNSRIEMSLGAGDYVIWVTSYSAGATGVYTLAVAGSEGSCTASAIAVGESRSGSLATSDCSDSDGRYMDAWTLSLAAGASVIVDLTSDELDTYLLLATPDGTVLQQDDDGGSGLNSRIETSLGAGDYVVWVTSYSAGVTGAYALAVAGSGGTSCTTAAIAVGQSRSGSLATSDCSDSGGRYMDPWTLSLAAGADVVVDLTSEEFDTYLVLARPDGTVLQQDDDGGGGLNSRIEASLAAGDYVVWATSFSAGATGAYALAVAGSDDTSCTATAIAVGESRSGSLATSDCSDSDGRYMDPWTLTLAAGATVIVDLASEAFDTYLLLARPDGTVLQQDDDSGGELNSRIEISLGAGTYVVWATSFSAGATGAYTLAVAGSDDTSCTAAAIAVGESRSGSLATSDCSDSDGRYMDAWTFSLAAGASVIVDLTSDAFDTYLLLATPDGTVLQQDDDGGGGLNSRIQASLGAGDYVVWATSYAPGATGSYTVRLAASSGDQNAACADLDGDGRVTARDADIVLLWLLDPGGANPPLKADMDGDGRVTLADALMMAEDTRACGEPAGKEERR